MKIALVTGTSSGIGLHTAVLLAKEGFHVVATMRDPRKAVVLVSEAAAAGVEVEVRTLDVTDQSSAESCVDALIAEHGQIDVLVNNAGRGSLGSLEQLSVQDLRDQLEVNYVGVAALTRLVLPHMRAAGSGRVVTVTSVGGSVGQPFADAYCAAKFAVEGLMQSLAPVVATFGIGISVVEPGPVGTEFVTNLDGVGLQPAADDPYGPLLASYLERTKGAFAGAQTPAEVAAVVVEAATCGEAKFRWHTSPAAAGFVGMSLKDLDGSGVLSQTSTWLR